LYPRGNVIKSHEPKQPIRPVPPPPVIEQDRPAITRFGQRLSRVKDVKPRLRPFGPVREAEAAKETFSMSMLPVALPEQPVAPAFSFATSTLPEQPGGSNGQSPERASTDRKTLIISPLDDFEQMYGLKEAIARLPGIEKVLVNRFEEEVLELEVKYSGSYPLADCLRDLCGHGKTVTVQEGSRLGLKPSGQPEDLGSRL
ncbi:MAG TPA: hypothetical protein VNL15_01015, partial [Dehalococcoidia bacterium]|nr:hypothetical protein [Dehalococcoidia bacterium]